MLDHAQPSDAEDLFGEALEIKKDHAGALMGMALIAADGYEARAADLARKALEADPKLTEAQELLARLALEDNDNAKATEEAKKAIAMDPKSVQGRAILATIDLLADKKDSTWDPKTAKGYETVGHFFVLNRRYEEGIEYYRKAIAMDPQLYSARAQLGINLMRLGHDEEAYKQLELCYNNDYQDAATRNSLKLMDSYKNFVTFTTTDNTILVLHKKAKRSCCAPYIESRDEAGDRDLREEVQAQARTSCASRSLSGPRRFRRPHAGHTPDSARWASPSDIPSPWTALRDASPGPSTGRPRCGTK